MSFLLPFLVGTVFGGVVTWQVDRQRQKDDNGSFFKRRFSRKKDQNSAPDSPPSGSESPGVTPDAAPKMAEATDTGAETSSQPPTYGD